MDHAVPFHFKVTVPTAMQNDGPAHETPFSCPIPPVGVPGTTLQLEPFQSSIKVPPPEPALCTPTATQKEAVAHVTPLSIAFADAGGCGTGVYCDALTVGGTAPAGVTNADVAATRAMTEPMATAADRTSALRRTAPSHSSNQGSLTDGEATRVSSVLECFRRRAGLAVRPAAAGRAGHGHGDATAPTDVARGSSSASIASSHHHRA